MNKANDTAIIKELHHQCRTLDMWLTIDQKLFTRYRRQARFLEAILLLCALLLCLTTFVDSRVLQLLLITPIKGQIILGISSFAILIVSLLFWITDWKEKAACFEHAVDILNHTYAECHDLLKKIEETEADVLRVKSLVYGSVINNLPRITEKDFYKLKAFHKRQLELDKMIELYPGSSVWLLRIFTFFQANMHVLLRKPFMKNIGDENSNE